MSECSTWKSGSAYTTIFKVVDSSDAAVTGLVNGNFTKKLTKDAVNSAVTVTVTEIDSTNEPGWYKAVYTPNANGLWTLIVTHATYNAIGWQDDVQAYADDIHNGTAQTGDAFARLGAPAGASVSADVAAVQADVTFVRDVEEGDESIDKADATQYQQVIKKKGTATEKIRKKLYKSDGTTKVNADTDVVGKRSET